MNKEPKAPQQTSAQRRNCPGFLYFPEVSLKPANKFIVLLILVFVSIVLSVLSLQPAQTTTFLWYGLYNVVGSSTSFLQSLSNLKCPSCCDMSNGVPVLTMRTKLFLMLSMLSRLCGPCLPVVLGKYTSMTVIVSLRPYPSKCPFCESRSLYLLWSPC